MAYKRWSDLVSLGNFKSLPGRLWDILYNHLYVLPGSREVWDDVIFPIIVKQTGAGKPTYSTWNTDYDALTWNVNDKASTEYQEFFHRGKENQSGSVHLHCVTNGSDSTDRYIKWEVKVTWAPLDSVFPASTTLTVETLIPANTPANTHLILSMGTILLTKIATHIKMSIKRIASTGTAPSWNPICEQAHIHVLCDSAGSATIQAK